MKASSSASLPLVAEGHSVLVEDLGDTSAAEELLSVSVSAALLLSKGKDDGALDQALGKQLGGNATSGPRCISQSWCGQHKHFNTRALC